MHANVRTGHTCVHNCHTQHSSEQFRLSSLSASIRSCVKLYYVSKRLVITGCVQSVLCTNDCMCLDCEVKTDGGGWLHVHGRAVFVCIYESLTGRSPGWLAGCVPRTHSLACWLCVLCQTPHMHCRSGFQLFAVGRSV